MWKRANIRLKLLERNKNWLYEEGDFADIVRESQEALELALKAILIFRGINFPRVHDVGNVLKENRDRFPELEDKEISMLSNLSRELRAHRELSFYGAEDVLPLEYYDREYAEKILSELKIAFNILKKVMGEIN